MKALIDTSTLLALVRYYLPFDQDGSLEVLIKEMFDKGSFVIIDRVYEESKYTSGGVILTRLPFIDPSTDLIAKTDQLLPSKVFLNLLNNQFCNKALVKQKDITPAEFEVLKQGYLETADGRLLLYAHTQKKQSGIAKGELMLVTEETPMPNDGKVFKKLPACCPHLDVRSCTLPELLKDYYNISVGGFRKY